jgi:hypothetical protein
LQWKDVFILSDKLFELSPFEQALRVHNVPVTFLSRDANEKKVNFIEHLKGQMFNIAQGSVDLLRPQTDDFS